MQHVNWVHIDGLVQERHNSSALAMELRLSCITHRFERYYNTVFIIWYYTFHDDEKYSRLLLQRSLMYCDIILCMCSANETQCYIVTLSLIGWAHAQNDPCDFTHSTLLTVAERVSDLNLNTDTPHLALMGCLLWGFGRNWPHYNSFALYMIHTCIRLWAWIWLPHHTLTGKLWSVSCDNLGGKWRCW